MEFSFACIAIHKKYSVAKDDFFDKIGFLFQTIQNPITEHTLLSNF